MFAARDASFQSIPNGVWGPSCTGGRTDLPDGSVVWLPQHCVVPGAAGITIDSTPHFRGGNRACNLSHPPEDEPCLGRNCEDPRGGEWRWAGADCHVQRGFQLVCNRLVAGQTVSWSVCPLPDLVDAVGHSVAVIEPACTSGKVEIR